MFETRLHHISPGDAVNKRKIWEGFLQWANRLSNLDSDSIARLQFDRDNFSLDSFLEMHSAGFSVGVDSGIVSSETSTSIVASKKIVSLDIAGDYWIDWSMTLKVKSGNCSFVGGVPFIGNEFFGSAQDFKSTMGFFQNTTITQFVETPSVGVRTGYYDDVWKYNFYGSQTNYVIGETASGDELVSYEKGVSIAPEFSENRYADYYHLSGCGAASVGRVTGNIGVVAYCQDESTLEVVGANMSIRRRVR